MNEDFIIHEVYESKISWGPNSFKDPFGMPKMSLTINEQLPLSIHWKLTEHRSCLQNNQLAMKGAFESKNNSNIVSSGRKVYQGMTTLDYCLQIRVWKWRPRCGDFSLIICHDNNACQKCQESQGNQNKLCICFGGFWSESMSKHEILCIQVYILDLPKSKHFTSIDVPHHLC